MESSSSSSGGGGGGGGGENFLLALPDDVLSLVSARLSPKDLISLSISSRSLLAAVATSEKIWLSQCLKLFPDQETLQKWRSGVRSFLALCRFLTSVHPLLGVWVHQNPELGNVVYVVFGYLSVIACRIIPQELAPLGLDAGPLLWAPVFEIVSGFDGSPSCFFLHGRGNDGTTTTTTNNNNNVDCLHPGLVRSIGRECNVLLLEVDAAMGNSESTVPPPPPFSRLAFGDRRQLLDIVSGRVRHRFEASDVLFTVKGEDASALAERRMSMVHIHRRAAAGRIDWRSAGLSSIERSKSCSADAGSKKRSFLSVMRQIMGKPSSLTGISSSMISKNGSGVNVASESKHVPLNEFLKAGDTVGLTLRATNMRLTTYRAWPNMHDNRFALYKLPLQEPADRREYAGLWGGTFGWPPGRPSEDKPGKALFFLLLSYEEIAGEFYLIATKILEGTHYVLHPNGSAMFIVKVDEPATESFPWEIDGDGVRVEVKHTFSGEGIANGYGFRYPGSKPGSLFEIHNGLLAFVWKESKAVLTLQRLDLEELLKKGEQVPPLPPVANFAYLTKSYSNVFAGFPSSCSPSPR